MDRYQARWDNHPVIGSLVWYMTVQSVVAVLEKAGSTDSEAIRVAFADLGVETPVGPITFRAIDHQR